MVGEVINKLEQLKAENRSVTYHCYILYFLILAVIITFLFFKKSQSDLPNKNFFTPVPKEYLLAS